MDAWKCRQGPSKDQNSKWRIPKSQVPKNEKKKIAISENLKNEKRESENPRFEKWKQGNPTVQKTKLEIRKTQNPKPLTSLLGARIVWDSRFLTT
jgi:hypothetical protein